MTNPTEGVGGSETRATAPAFVKPRPSPWNWLLLPPVILPLLSFFWNRKDPQLFGIPFFYWIQLLLVLVTSACCGVVYLKTKSGSH
ncbi:DUF3311 domain-containing protein [Cumulibacter manganitolerans]|uniref:DUF3311 domain-containing protein n=1 Tax=Cumulibacter manganitolerans TaxID=1884992 RepID=UPI0012971808|nr:DUF3311 domain-containing protein [Cumulibacter manganitolerans]